MLKDEKGRMLCNFDVCVEGVDEVCIIGKDRTFSQIHIRLLFDENDSSPIFTVIESELERISWSDLDERCCLNPDISLTKIKRYLANSIRLQKKNASRKRVYQLSSTGISIIGREAVFCTGLEVIKASTSNISDMIIGQRLMNSHLDIDISISEPQVVSEMFDLVSLSPNPGRILWAHKLLYIMRQAYIDAGVKPNVCIYLYGSSGTNKTTFASFLTQMYNRREGINSPVRLNASIASAVQILLDVSDDVIVFDDLFPVESKQIRRHQEETLIEITRYVADGITPARMNGRKISKNTPKCGVVFTGEYLIGNGSNAARLLAVEMIQPNGEKLKYFQDHPLVVSTFYYFYIRWFVENYKEIVGVLSEWLNRYRKINLGVHKRLQETHFFLNTAYAMLMQYCYEKNLMEKSDICRLQSSFGDLLTKLVKKQNERTQMTVKNEQQCKNYWECFQMLYLSGQILIADNVGQFNEKLHDGLIHRKCLYFRGNKIMTYFPNASINDLVDELVSQGVLETGKGSNTKQISTLKGKRFYVIPLNLLDKGNK